MAEQLDQRQADASRFVSSDSSTAEASTTNDGINKDPASSLTIGDLRVTVGKTTRINVPLSGILGYGTMMGWSSILLWSGCYYDASVPELTVHMLRALYLLAAFVTLLASLRFRIDRRLLEKPVVALVALTAVAAFSAATVFAPLPLAITGASWVIAGMASAFLVNSWHIHLVSKHQKTVLLIMGGAFVLSGSTLFFYTQLSPLAGNVLAVVLPVFSLLLFYGTEGRAKKVLDAHREKTARLDKGKFFTNEITLSLLCNGLTGLLASCATSDPFAPVAIPAVALAFFASGLLMIVLLFREQRNLAYSFLGVLLPVICIGLLVFAFGPIIAKCIAIAVMVFILSCFDVLSTSNLARNSKFVFSVFTEGLARGRAWNRLAFLVGWIAGYAMLMWWDVEPNALVICSFVLIIAFSITLFMRLFNRLKKPAEETARPAMPVETPSPIEVVEGESADTMGIDDACEILIKRYKLTKREAEIMTLLAQGRNAHYVSEELVLSVNTVKTHTYNQYGKMGIHSQQELIGMVHKVMEN